MGSKIDMIGEISTLLDEMRPLLIEAGIHSSMLKMPDIYDIKDEKVTSLRQALKWTRNIYFGLYKQLEDVKDFLPQSVWDNHLQFGAYDLAEMRLLRQFQTRIRKTWYNTRPGFFLTKTRKKIRKKHGKSRSQTSPSPKRQNQIFTSSDY